VIPHLFLVEFRIGFSTSPTMRWLWCGFTPEMSRTGLSWTRDIVLENCPGQERARHLSNKL
jgi:hypothetical protein